jgi:hypothetical protein
MSSPKNCSVLLNLTDIGGNVVQHPVCEVQDVRIIWKQVLNAFAGVSLAITFTQLFTKRPACDPPVKARDAPRLAGLWTIA